MIGMVPVIEIFPAIDIAPVIDEAGRKTHQVLFQYRMRVTRLVEKHTTTRSKRHQVLFQYGFANHNICSNRSDQMNPLKRHQVPFHYGYTSHKICLTDQMKPVKRDTKCHFITDIQVTKFAVTDKTNPLKRDTK